MNWFALRVGIILAVGLVACDSGGSDDAGAGGTGTAGTGAGGTSAGTAGTGAGGTSAGTAGTGAGMGGTGSAPSAPDACDLLSVEEWTPLMGGAPSVDDASGRCDWTYEPSGTRDQWANLNVADAAAYSVIPMSEALDIGDEGYQSTPGIARTIDIGWKKGDFSATFKYSVMVLPAGANWDDLRAAAVELAKTAADRMP